MKRSLRRAVKVLAALLILAVVGALGWGAWMIWRGFPDHEGELRLAGLSGEVVIQRDRWGVPHLFAREARDLLFAQGYVHAQDRLWQMSFHRVIAGGRLASLFGEAALPADRYLRTLGIRRSAERDLALLEPETVALLEAYVAGINASLAEQAGKPPVELAVLGVPMEPWTPLDVLAFAKLMSMNLSLNSSLELLRAKLGAEVGAETAARFLPPYPADAPVILPPKIVPPAAAQPNEALAAARLSAFLPTVMNPIAVGGSNAWVVAGSRTASGKPLLANDTHLGLSMPSPWTMNGLHQQGGGFDVEGFSLPGVPFVVMGQNARLAWGVTNLNADVQDLFRETLDHNENPTHYHFRGEMRPVTVIHERLAVKGGAEVDLPVYLTHHGPLMHGVTPGHQVGGPFSLAWPALDGSRLLDAMRRLNLASDWTSFREALSRWDSPSLNFVYADVDGNIGYQSTARVPRRAAGQEGTWPVDGASGEAEWLGLIPFEEMPSSLNPEQGFYATANNKVVGPDYPYLLTMDWPPADRARRITELLASGQGLTAEDMAHMALDTLSLPAGRMRPALLAAAQAETELQSQALALVADWDLRFEANSSGATIYQVWLDELLLAVVADELSGDLFREVQPILASPSPLLEAVLARPGDPLVDDLRTPPKENLEEIINRAFHSAHAWLTDELGAQPGSWSWGRLHRVAFTHQPLGASGVAPLAWIFNGKTGGIGGAPSTVLALAPDGQKRYTVGFGPSQRFVADLADLSRSRAINSTGQVGLPFHRHHLDLTELWSRGESIPLATNLEAAAGGGRIVLRPLAAGAAGEEP